MDRTFYMQNRKKLFLLLPAGAAALVFSGKEVRRTNDEFYPFCADRNFVYLTGLACKESVLVLIKTENGECREQLYLLPPDPVAERWTGRRVRPEEARKISGVEDIRPVTVFEKEMHTLLAGGHYSAHAVRLSHLYLDLFRAESTDRDRPAQCFLRHAQTEYPYLAAGNLNALLRRLRLIKAPCEIEAVRRAETITREGILAMMHISRPGLYEYQYKAAWEMALGRHSPEGNGFPPIISAGDNNFCIHYYSYTGQARDGDMILGDVGAQWDFHTTDVSRGWPCNGHFTDRQKQLYECALKTSDHMFGIIRPGMPMEDVDREIRRFNAERLTEVGVMKSPDEVGRYMWHGGAHHIGLDVHDVVERPEVLAPGMIFCVDVGIYHEEWGIGFRLEDNCLVTEDGCENLSAAIPRTPEEIEREMNCV